MDHNETDMNHKPHDAIVYLDILKSIIKQMFTLKEIKKMMYHNSSNVVQTLSKIVSYLIVSLLCKKQTRNQYQELE